MSSFSSRILDSLMFMKLVVWALEQGKRKKE